MKRKNLSQVLKRYPNHWVSLSGDYQKVLVSGKSLKNVITQLGKLGNPDGILMHVTDDYSQYAGYFLYISSD